MCRWQHKVQHNFRLLLLSLLFSAICLCSCKISKDDIPVKKSISKSSTFSIQFIDVGQGDSALVECDGRYMLIDGGDKLHGDKVYSVLEEKKIQHLDILVMSHLHEDHIGGLIKALTYASKIDLTISNSDHRENSVFKAVENELSINGAKITVSHIGEKYKLGSSEIEVIDTASQSENDSLVLLITYGKTRFLFTGDIEENAQERITKKYINSKDEPFKIDLLKMPHHGSYENTLYTFLRTFMADYIIISSGNQYGHPSEKTLDLLNNPKSDYKPKVYRTDKNGDIIVKSNGKSLHIETTK